MSDLLGQTPSQTVGPYYTLRLFNDGENVLVPQGHPGRIVIQGTVLDGDRDPIEDALLEIWQANAVGRYRHPDDTRELALDNGFTGFGRAITDFDTGEYRFETVKPGRVPDAEGAFQAPHISLIVQGRGCSTRCSPGSISPMKMRPTATISPCAACRRSVAAP